MAGRYTVSTIRLVSKITLQSEILTKNVLYSMFVRVLNSVPYERFHSRVVVFWDCKSYPSSPDGKPDEMSVG